MYSIKNVEDEIKIRLFCERTEWWTDQFKRVNTKTISSLAKMIGYNICRIDLLIMCRFHMKNHFRLRIEKLLDLCGLKNESCIFRDENYDVFLSDYIIK